VSVIEAQGIIGSIAYSFDGERLRLVWISSSDFMLDEVAKGARLKTTPVSSYLEARRNRGLIESVRAKNRACYKRYKERKKNGLGAFQKRDQAPHR